jgi:hypothetical protein
MANDSSSPREAEIAARRVQKLMEKHSLTETDLKYSTIVEEETDSVYARAESPPEYLRALVSIIEDIFDCKAIYRQTRQMRIAFIGTKADAITAKYAMEVLGRQLKSDRKAFILSLNNTFSKHRKTVLANNFALGWVSAVWTKAQCLRSFDKEKQAIVEGYFDKNYSNLAKLKQRNQAKTLTKNDHLAREMGIEKGKQAQLHRGVDVSAQANYLEELA